MHPCKRAQPPARLVEKKLRFTALTVARVQAYRQARDGKPEADAWRDLVYAGLAALSVPPLPAPPSIPLTKAA